MQTLRLAALLAAALAVPAMAQTPSTPRIDHRQANQERRIEQGAKSGAVTEKEAARLERHEAHIQKMENKAVSDGKVTRNERGRIDKAQNRESRRIYREKHDRQKAQ